MGLFDFDPSHWSIQIWTKDDRIDEPDSTLTVVIEYGEDLTSNSVTVPMLDDDPTVVSLARVGSEVISDGRAAVFTVRLGRELVAGEVIDVPLAVSGPGVSVSGYTLSVTSGPGVALSGTNTLTPNLCFSSAGAQTATLELRPAADSTVERYRIALGPDGDGANGFDRAGLGANVGGGADPHGTRNSFHVWKDLGHPSVTITGGPAEMSEGSTATFTLTANPAPSTLLTLTVDVTDSGDFATAGQTGSRTVSIGTDGRGSFTVTTVEDSTVEPNGAISATVQVGSGYMVGWPSSAAITVPGGDNQGIRLHALPWPPFGTELEITEGHTLMPEIESTPEREAMLSTDVTWEALLRMACGFDSRHTPELLPQLPCPALPEGIRLLLQRPLRLLGRHAKAHRQRHRRCAGAEPRLLPPPKAQGIQGETRVADQGANPLGAAKLVGGDGKQIHPQLAGVQGRLAAKLDSVAVEGNAAMAAADGAHGGQRNSSMHGRPPRCQTSLPPAASGPRSEIVPVSCTWHPPWLVIPTASAIETGTSSTTVV